MIITALSKKPSDTQPNLDLEMSVMTLLKSMQSNALNSDLKKSLSGLLKVIQSDVEVTKGYLAVLQGTCQRASQNPSMLRFQLIQIMAHHSLILSELLEMTWNHSEQLSSIIHSLQSENL